jgi:hypothetical protein
VICTGHMPALRSVLLVGVPIMFATGCRSGRPPATEQIPAFRRLLSMAAVAPADTVCVGLALGDGTRDAPPTVLAALRSEVPGVRALSECAHGPARKRLYLTSVKRTADTLIFIGAAGRTIYSCRVSYSAAWPGTCEVSELV